jgi:AcrR family transcriptional regulator
MQLFVEHGSKSLTMDDIAREFGMSKKTLYQKYINKEALLEEVLDFKLESVIEKMQNLNTEIENAVERMCFRDKQIENAVSANKTMMIRQLMKYYPKIFDKHIHKFSDRFSDVLVNNIERGREQGYYRKDFDAEFYAKLFFHLIISYDASPYFDTEEIDRCFFQNEIMMFYMNAITTERGKEILKTISGRQ